MQTDMAIKSTADTDNDCAIWPGVVVSGALAGGSQARLDSERRQHHLRGGRQQG